MTAAGGGDDSSKGRRWLTLLLRIAGLALLVYVVSLVDWRDKVVCADGSVVRGELVSEAPQAWDGATRVTIRTGDGAERSFGAADLAKDARSGLPQVDEGLLRIVRRSDKGLLALGLLAMGFVTQFGVVRWWLLLRAQGIRLPYRLANRLTFVGFFFNNVVPGPTGGDLVKAVYVARRTHKRAEAVVTVLVDRVVGIVALAAIAGAVLVFRLDDARYRGLATFIGLFLGGVAIAATLFFSRRVRRLLRFEHWSAKLPGGGLIRKVDEAIFLWRYHKRAVLVALLLSFGNQLSIQGIMILFAHALHVTTTSGDALAWTTYMAVLPVGLIVSAVPALPGGWGSREAAFVVCFAAVHVDRNPAIALSVLNGMMMLFWSLLGGVYFLLDRGELRAARVEEPPETAEAAG